MTLIEVLAGVALLGSLLVGIVLARGRYIRQWSNAQQRLEAVQAADALLNQWWASENSVPRNGSGSCGQHGSLRWRTQMIDSEDAEALNVQVLRLEIFDPSSSTDLLSEENAPVILVDVVVPNPKQPAVEDAQLGRKTP